MKFFRPIKYALEGILYTIKTERNMRIHIVVATYVLVFATFFNLTHTQWAVLVITISLVMFAEMFNTAIEQICNMYCQKYHPIIKIVKDVSAGAVLVCAICSIVVGITLFWRPQVLWQIIYFLGNNPEFLTIFILSIVISVLFVVIGPSAIASNAKSIIDKNKQD